LTLQLTFTILSSKAFINKNKEIIMKKLTFLAIGLSLLTVGVFAAPQHNTTTKDSFHPSKFSNVPNGGTVRETK
jgi:hypothetical protein